MEYDEPETKDEERNELNISKTTPDNTEETTAEVTQPTTENVDMIVGSQAPVTSILSTNNKRKKEQSDNEEVPKP